MQHSDAGVTPLTGVVFSEDGKIIGFDSTNQ